MSHKMKPSAQMMAENDCGGTCESCEGKSTCFSGPLELNYEGTVTAIQSQWDPIKTVAINNIEKFEFTNDSIKAEFPLPNIDLSTIETIEINGVQFHNPKLRPKDISSSAPPVGFKVREWLLFECPHCHRLSEVSEDEYVLPVIGWREFTCPWCERASFAQPSHHRRERVE